MRLYLMRHAIAAPHGTAACAQDAQRPLTEAGQLEARGVAQGLKRLEVPVALILTSPYLRAAQTAAQVAGVYGARTSVKELEALRAEAAPRDASLALKAFAEYDGVLCVGHEPHLSAWISELTDGMHCLMKKGGVACVEIERVPPPRGSGTLRWLLTPKQLTLIGKKVSDTF